MEPAKTGRSRTEPAKTGQSRPGPAFAFRFFKNLFDQLLQSPGVPGNCSHKPDFNRTSPKRKKKCFIFTQNGIQLPEKKDKKLDGKGCSTARDRNIFDHTGLKPAARTGTDEETVKRKQQKGNRKGNRQQKTDGKTEKKTGNRKQTRKQKKGNGKKAKENKKRKEENNQ